MHKSSTIGPRPELRHEMMAEADVEFYMYHSDTFMQHATDYLKSEVDHKAIEEVETARAARREEARRSQEFLAAAAPLLTANQVNPKWLMHMIKAEARESEAAIRAVSGSLASSFFDVPAAELSALRQIRKQATETRSMLRRLMPSDVIRQVMESQGLSEDDARKWISSLARSTSRSEDADVDDDEGAPIRDESNDT